MSSQREKPSNVLERNIDALLQRESPEEAERRADLEQFGCIAVEFRTHRFNQQSRRAIERLGAKLDGILRNHRRLADGSLRDTCVYSILASEWPATRQHLQFQLARRRVTGEENRV